jgi:carboxynorspermidine decarboxylase
MQYSLVKNNVFNGTRRPDIAMLDEDGGYRVLRSYGYDDFRAMLG